MQIQEHQDQGVTILKPIGGLHQEAATQFRQRLETTLTQCSTPGAVVVDFSHTTSVDSLALEALVDVSGRLAKAGLPLKICGINATQEEVLHLTDLTMLFESFDDSALAIKSFA